MNPFAHALRKLFHEYQSNTINRNKSCRVLLMNSQRLVSLELDLPGENAGGFEDQVPELNREEANFTQKLTTMRGATAKGSRTLAGRF